MIKKLKKFKRDVVYEIVYYMKKQFKNNVDENNFLLENDHRLKKKKTSKNNIKSLNKSYKTKSSKFYKKIDVFKNVIKKNTLSITKISSKNKRSIKISNSSLFLNEKAMFVLQ